MPSQPKNTAKPAKAIYLFHGEDSYSAYQKLTHWRQEFEKKFGDFNVQVLDGADLTAGQFQEAAETLPFLSEKKLIIIRGFLKEAPIEELRNVAEKLEKVDDHCVIVFLERNKADSRTALFKNIKKNGQIMDFPPMEPPALTQWIIQEVRKKNGTIGNREAAELAMSVGPDLWQMESEIEKLCLYSGSKPDSNDPSPITTDTIESLTSPNIHASIFKLTDQLAQQNRRAALKTLHNLIESGENMIPMLFMLVRHIRIMIQVKDCLAKKLKSPAIIKKMKEHPFVINNAIKQTSHFSEQKLATMYRQLLDIDIGTKSGTIKITTGDHSELRLAIEKFIIHMTSHAAKTV